MKTKKVLKQTLTIIAVTLILLILNIGESKAALQANPNTHAKKVDTLPNWITNIRKMEKSGEALGLSETLNDDLTASSESNGIDMHMMKSTEYGAIAILSASGYGNPQTLQESAIKTTTGNKSGVYFTGNNWEYVAGGMDGYIPSGVNPIYYDAYNEDAKVGDAFGTSETDNPGCRGWHSAQYQGWCNSAPYREPYFRRGNVGLFSYLCYDPTLWSNGILPSARGVAVCGTGL